MKVKIYQPIKTPTQSGKKKHSWLMIPMLDENYKSIDNLMGWTSSFDTKSQIKIKFNTAEEAIKYAASQGFEFEVEQPKTAKIIKKSYADNFQ